MGVREGRDTEIEREREKEGRKWDQSDVDGACPVERVGS